MVTIRQTSWSGRGFDTGRLIGSSAYLILRVKETDWESFTMAISESSVWESQDGC